MKIATAYHAAMVNSGVFIYIQKYERKDIIESHFVQNNLVDEAFVKTRVNRADKSSSVSYVERFEGVGYKEYGLYCCRSYHKGAKVQFAAVDTFGQSTDAYVNSSWPP